MICSFVVNNKFLETYIHTFELLDLVFTYFPCQDQEAETASEWQIEVYSDTPEEIIKAIKNVQNKFGLPTTEISIKEIENKDWVTEVQKNFKPILVENIYIYSSYYQESLDQHKNSICINIDPGNAFGTGEHHTTKGCLRALSLLKKNYNFANIMDMGSGSAILAIAAAKLFSNCKILATDIDEDAVKVAQENIIKNNTENITVIQADGINHKLIKTDSPFELIICNILSSVLIEIAPDVNDISRQNTIIILSGLTIRQLDDVITRYTSFSFTTLQVIHEDEWCTVIMKKQ